MWDQRLSLLKLGLMETDFASAAQRMPARCHVNRRKCLYRRAQTMPVAAYASIAPDATVAAISSASAMRRKRASAVVVVVEDIEIPL
jgi:hypothetical protein